MPWFIADDNFKEHWNRFVIEHNGSFLQSREWGEFQKKSGQKVWPLIYKENNETQAVALIIRHGLPFGFSYFYCPRGPIVNSKISAKGGQKSKIFEEFLKKMKEIGAEEKAIFFKVEPPFAKASEDKPDADFPLNLAESGFVKSKKEIQPAETVILDLTKTEEELLAEMKSKTRYNINLAERKGVTIINSQIPIPKSQFEKFFKLLEETAKREGFHLHERTYYEKLLEIRSPNFSSELFLAEYKDKIIAGHLIIFFGNQAIYLHGASSREHKETMAPYLLHRETIKEARRRGCLTYDFWGISEKKWPGLTRFKKSFGGFEKTYPGASDLVFDKFWYWVYNIVRKIRNITGRDIS